MNLSAYTRTIKDILTLSRKYIIPRYQREYSWEKIELEEFWNDIVGQLQFVESKITATDYFIGSLVLVGDDSKDTSFLVVDGQQRLTTITILLSVLTEISKKVDTNFSNSCYTYVEGKDDDYKPYFKLENENPKPFLQRRIQNIEKESDRKPTSHEEEKLLFAYDFFSRKLSQIKKDYASYLYTDLLKAIRDQLLKCQTIFITVESESEAQTIFETLNAKGKDLETLDLVKNKIFETLSEEHPTDFAKETWTKIKSNIRSREDPIQLSVFFRHFWISKYEFITENKIYSSFQKYIQNTSSQYKIFLEDLSNGSLNYIKIISPLPNDWNLQENKNVFNSLTALRVFRVTQPRPLLLTLLSLYEKKLLKPLDLVKYIEKIEYFHFLFSAICSSRPSGLESIYSKYSRNIVHLIDKHAIRKNLDDLVKKLFEKIPTFEVFFENFKNLHYSNTYTKDKKLIQYIFRKLEEEEQTTDELTINKITLEHIKGQSSKAPWVSGIGNILPLSRKINETVENRELKFKIPEFENSELKIVKRFCLENKTCTSWTEEKASLRTEALARECYDIFKVAFQIDV